MVLAGAIAGICAGLAASRLFTALLYNVKPTDVRSLAAPLAAILIAAILAALPAVIRALRIDPVILLRSE
jgi:ABC-type antimicrobial peptide transport system permease subunit